MQFYECSVCHAVGLEKSRLTSLPQNALHSLNYHGKNSYTIVVTKQFAVFTVYTWLILENTLTPQYCSFRTLKFWFACIGKLNYNKQDDTAGFTH